MHWSQARFAIEPADLLRVRTAPVGLAVDDPELVESMAPPLHQAGDMTISALLWFGLGDFEGEEEMGGNGLVTVLEQPGHWASGCG